MAITFGWRIPDFPVDGSNQVEFRTQIFNYLDMLEGHFETAWAGDHFFPWMDTVDQRVDTIEALTTLTYVLAKYPRLKAGTIVLSQGYRSPALLAKMAANMQWLSGGRFILGIGAGWKENEYRAYGYEYPSTGQRLAELDEAVQVIRAMWTQPAPAFQGQILHHPGRLLQSAARPPTPTADRRSRAQKDAAPGGQIRRLAQFQQLHAG
jgi:alkanesulfonate monooxygenase SsuD/methylene tetrahydromethanopterin reductase-like flavin-dependent oxidoreductase (luciferase family)